MNDKEKLISLLILADPNPYTCESESGSCELTTCTECRARSTADLLIANGVTVQERVLPEEEYYVLRNTETGMYFRGKGVNRWGKHFNQATIYRVKGTAEHSIKEVAWHGEKAELVRIKIVEMPQQPKGE